MQNSVLLPVVITNPVKRTFFGNDSQLGKHVSNGANLWPNKVCYQVSSRVWKLCIYPKNFTI